MNSLIKSTLLACLTMLTAQTAAFDLLAPFAKLYWQDQVGRRLTKAEQQNGYLLETLAQDAAHICTNLINKKLDGKTNLSEYVDKTCWDLNLLYNEEPNVDCRLERDGLKSHLTDLIAAFNKASAEIQHNHSDLAIQKLSDALADINTFREQRGVSQKNAARLQEFVLRAQESNVKIKKIITKERLIGASLIAATITSGYILWKYCLSAWFKNKTAYANVKPAKLPENVTHVNVVGQQGNTCGIHAALNCHMIQEYAKDHKYVFNNKELQDYLTNQAEHNEFMNVWNILKIAINENRIPNDQLPSTDLDQTDIIDILTKFETNNIHFVRYLKANSNLPQEQKGVPLSNPNLYEKAHPFRCPEGITNLDDHLEALKKETSPGLVHVIFHFGYHWVQASVVKDVNNTIQIYYTDSLNSTIYEKTPVEQFLNYLHNAVKPSIS